LNNPFRFGEPVTGDFFISRDNEMSEMVTSAEAHKNIVIFGERRLGKSSLFAETARRNAKDFLFVKVDACAVADENQLLDCFTREVVRAGVGRAWRIEPGLWDLLKTRRMRAALSPGGDLVLADKILSNIPERVATERARGDSPAPSDEKEPRIRMCPRCGRPLKWIEAYKRHFCYSCKKYAPRQKRIFHRSGREWDPSGGPDSCPDCASAMQYAHRYSEFFCPKCARYPQMERRVVTEPWAREDMMAALELPQKLSELKGKPVVMMLDDFHEIAELGDERLLEAMRLRFEEHEGVTYFFAGSSKESMQRVFEDRNGAFYKFAGTMQLGRIPDPEMQRFVMSRFRSGGGRLSEDAAKRIIGVSEGIPSYVQQIGHELFHISSNPEVSEVEDAIRRVVRQQEQVHSLLWDSIRSPLQRRYLFAIAKEPGVPHGESFIRRYGLRSRSHVQRAASQLEAKGLVGKGEILDPMFVIWLRSRDSR